MAAARATLASLDDLQRTASRILDAFGEDDHRTGRGGLAGPAVRRGHPPPADTAGGAAGGRPGAAEPAVRPAHGGAHLGHAGPRRLVRPPGHPVGFAAARRLPSSDGDEEPGDMAGPRRRLAVRPPAQRHPVRRQAPAAAGPGRAARGVPDEIDELIDAAGGRTLGLFSSMRAAKAGGRGAARADQPAAALPGRRPHRPAGQAVRRGRADLPVRHAVAVAGRGRARATRCSWWSSTGSRSRGPTTRSPRPGSARWPPAAATGS